jgi:transmembrane sensor
VVLGVGSALRTADHWWGSRDVYLEGEAYFEVRHDAARPFVVHTARGATEDLGTSFDVRAYPTDGALRVVVRDGRVAVGGTHTLGAGDLAVIDSAGRATIVRGVAVDDYTGWTDGRIVFRDVPLRQALAELARWYDLDVTLTDASAGERRVSGRFADAPASRVLDTICASAGVRWVQVGRAVAVSPNAHSTR